MTAAEGARKGVRVERAVSRAGHRRRACRRNSARLSHGSWAVSPEEQLAGVLGTLLQGRGQTADEIARAALFLCSERIKRHHLDKQINVDGGAAFF